MTTFAERKTQRMAERASLFLEKNEWYLKKIGPVCSVLRFRPRIRNLYAAYEAATDLEQKNRACVDLLNAVQESLLWKAIQKARCAVEDLRVWKDQIGKRKVIDRSDHRCKDTYSVAVIVKNEARYIREFILFYRATGADRIYLYDNDSTDSLMEELEPFLASGFVVYRRWTGKKVQLAAYRDVIRRTRRRTKWLALVDADEFLFSPRGSMPQQLQAYESFPGVCVDWLFYGPNGHEKRPDGLIMDNYTTRVADALSPMNCHVKSIVRPCEVVFMNHVHYAVYRKGQYAVNECGDRMDNTCAFIGGGGRAFTAVNHKDVFRINHYATKSLEDLTEKCRRGYPDGTPNAVLENQLLPFREPLTEDYAIKPYADIVRAQY